ncbi:hypothetical protein N7454_004430 [Penicillium verhagenii]|nr:hypothetical protein N7454_004430 [Penicillium verhagenii]
MDTLFSLPILSLVLIPTMSSYATSLNFLFFYVTWSTLVLSHSPLRVELVGSAAVRLIFFLLPSVIFFLFDILTPSAAVIIKAHGQAGLPAGRSFGMVRVRDLKVAFWAIFNVVLATVLQGAIETLLVQVLQVRSAVKVSMKLPMPWQMGQGLVLGLLIREALTYYVHRYGLHNPRSVFTRYLSRCHQAWYHSLRTPFPLTAHYDHPLVYIFIRFIPTYLPALLLRFHMLTYIFYLTFVSIEETFAYCGYTVMPTNFFMGGIARRTDEHLIGDGVGNFGPWGIWDWALGSSTTSSAGAGEDPMADLDEQEIEKRVRETMEASKRKIREGTLRRNTRPT